MLLQDATAFGLLPYLDHVLRSSPAIAAPDFVRAQASLARDLNAQLLLRRRAMVRRLLGLLHGQGIPVILLKGFPLAHFAYPSPDCRQMSDVDILTPPGTLAAVRDAAGQLGFVDTEVIQSLKRMGSPLHTKYTLLKSEDGRVRLDIHDAVPSFAPFRMDLAAVWDRSRPVTAAEIDFRVLAPEDFLAHLSLHLAHHHAFTSRLIGCLDLRLFLESREGISLDWDVLAVRCREAGSLRWVQLALAVAQRITGAAVPGPFLRDLPEDFGAAVDLGVEQCFYAGRTQIDTNFMNILAAPSLARIARWRRDYEDTHAVAGPYGESAATTAASRLHHLGSILRRLRTFLAREGLHLGAWRNAILVARSRSKLLSVTERWNDGRDG